MDSSKTMRALVVSSFDKPLTVERVPVPKATEGSAVVLILAANILPYHKDVYNGKRKYPLCMPLIGGSSGIGRIESVGPDATKLRPGQLVHIDIMVRSRDDPAVSILLGTTSGFSEASTILMDKTWRNATFAEYAKLPLENLTVLNEARLLGSPADGGLGYTVENLAYISRYLVPYGGFRAIDLRPGETVVVAPATGGFGGAAVLVALALGAFPIAMGRNTDALNNLAARDKRIKTVKITGNVEDDAAALQKFGKIDAYLDISPPMAATSTHIKSAITSLRQGGRVALMGGIMGDISLPHAVIMFSNLTIKGNFMYERSALGEVVKMVQLGLLPLGEAAGIRLVGKFPLEQWEAAFESAEKNAGVGQQTLMTPLIM